MVMPLIGPEGREQLKLVGRFGAIGIELVVATLIGYFGGEWLDGRFHTKPWLMILGLLFGIAAGFRALWRVARNTKLDKL